jgi:hypothetical protein
MDSYKNYTCPVCLDKMDIIYSTACDHIFCSKCIIKMFKNKEAICCPLCRTELQNDKVTKIMRPIYDIPENPDFSFIDSECDRNSLVKAYATINRLDKWKFLKNYEPNPELGFMFDGNEEINNIKMKIIDDNQLHSGISLGLTMRHMSYIARYGFTEYKESLDIES